MTDLPSLRLHAFGPTRAARVEWVLAELGIPYERVEVDLLRGEHRGPDYLRLNPMGRVPALEVDGRVLTESLALCTWLADRFDPGGWIPTAGSLDRAEHDRWMYFLATELDAPLWRHRRHRVLHAEEDVIPAEIPAAARDFRAAAEVLQGWLGDRPTALDRPTVLDLCLAHTLFWASWSDLLDGLPALQRYTEGLMARPGCPESMRG